MLTSKGRLAFPQKRGLENSVPITGLVPPKCEASYAHNSVDVPPTRKRFLFSCTSADHLKDTATHRASHTRGQGQGRCPCRPCWSRAPEGQAIICRNVATCSRCGRAQVRALQATGMVTSTSSPGHLVTLATPRAHALTRSRAPRLGLAHSARQLVSWCIVHGPWSAASRRSRTSIGSTRVQRPCPLSSSRPLAASCPVMQSARRTATRPDGRTPHRQCKGS